MAPARPTPLFLSRYISTILVLLGRSIKLLPAARNLNGMEEDVVRGEFIGGFSFLHRGPNLVVGFCKMKTYEYWYWSEGGQDCHRLQLCLITYGVHET